MNAGVDMDSCSVHAKTIGPKKLCTRVIITMYTSIPTNEFTTLFDAIEKMFQAAEKQCTPFCVLFHLHSGVSLGPLQIGSLVMILSKYRHVTKKHSITTAIVASSSLSDIVNMIFSMYRPVGHVEFTEDLSAAKHHCKLRACEYESSINESALSEFSEMKVD